MLEREDGDGLPSDGLPLNATRDDLVDLLSRLAEQLATGENWDNQGLLDYLQAMQGFLSDFDGYLEAYPQAADGSRWFVMGELLLAARNYE